MKKTLSMLLVLAFVLAAFCVLPGGASARDELKNTDPEKYYILLDTNNQVVTVFEKDEKGEYTRVVRRFVCSSGKKDAAEDGSDQGMPTSVGVWRIGGRERFGRFAKFGEYARYWTQIVQDIYFHSIMFDRKDLTRPISSAYSSLGNDVSHGCVRLLVEDAKWLYYYACPGTRVRVSNSEKYNRDLARAAKGVRNSIKFKNYKVLQANFFDEEELPNKNCWVTDKSAALHKESKRSSKIVRHLDLGEQLEVLMYNDAWVKVKCSHGREGYVYRGYVSMNENEPDTKEGADVMRVTAWMFSKTEAAQENRICKIPVDTPLILLSTNEEAGFARVSYWGEEGYVQTKYITQKVAKDMTKSGYGEY